MLSLHFLFVKKMNIEFKKATIIDSPAVLKLLTELYLELGEEKESIKFLTSDLIHFILDSGATEIYLVKENLKDIGLITLTESQAIYAGGKYGVIDEMYIIPNYRENKIGEKMIKYIFSIAKDKK